MDGITATTKIREISNVPIILLTAKSEDTDKVLGLNIGAYTQLGGGEVRPSRIRIGSITLDDSEKSVYLDGDIVALTPREYDILKLFMKNPGMVFSPKDIYRKVWGEIPINAENAVAVHIRHLREKLEIDPAEPRYIKVVWGQGYKIERDAK